MTEKLWACDWCATVQCRETEPARCYSGECKDRRGVHAFSVITDGSLVFPAPSEVTPPAPSYAERRAALVQECKEVCEQCRLHPWRHMDTDNLAWAWHTDSPGRDFCEARHVSPCLRTRREIAALDADNEKAALKKALYSTKPALDAEEAAKAKSPPAPDESLNAEALALCHLYAQAEPYPMRVLTDDEFSRTPDLTSWLALAREVRGQKEELLIWATGAIDDPEKAKPIIARIAALKGETDGK